LVAPFAALLIGAVTLARGSFVFWVFLSYVIYICLCQNGFFFQVFFGLAWCCGGGSGGLVLCRGGGTGGRVSRLGIFFLLCQLSVALRVVCCYVVFWPGVRFVFFVLFMGVRRLVPWGAGGMCRLLERSVGPREGCSMMQCMLDLVILVLRLLCDRAFSLVFGCGFRGVVVCCLGGQSFSLGFFCAAATPEVGRCSS